MAKTKASNEQQQKNTRNVDWVWIRGKWSYIRNFKNGIENVCRLYNGCGGGDDSRCQQSKLQSIGKCVLAAWFRLDLLSFTTQHFIVGCVASFVCIFWWRLKPNGEHILLSSIIRFPCQRRWCKWKAGGDMNQCDVVWYHKIWQYSTSYNSIMQRCTMKNSMKWIFV